MQSKNKTIETNASIIDFLNSIDIDEQKRKDSIDLIDLMKKWSGHEPKMWGPSIIGFGSYHYKYNSGYEGDSLLIGFSPRKAAFSLYITAPQNVKINLLEDLGKCKMSKSCIYFKKLSDLDLKILEKLCKVALDHK